MNTKRKEFIGLLGGVLNSEARKVHTAFMDKWDFKNEDNANYDAPENAERCRKIWKKCRRDRLAFMTLRA